MERMHRYRVISSPGITRLRRLPDPRQQRGEEEGGDCFLQGRMMWGRSKLHACLPKCLDQTKGTQMAEADKGVSYCVGFFFFFLLGTVLGLCVRDG